MPRPGLVLFLVLTVLPLVGCGREGAKAAGAGGGERPEVEAARDESEHYERLLAGKEDERAAEARDWLDPKHANHVAWKVNKKRMREMTDALYAAGAVKVYAVYDPADETVKVELCAELLVALPAGKAERQKVIAACNKIEQQVWGPDAAKATDVGQKFISLNLDP
jgi:hypothetical protein